MTKNQFWAVMWLGAAIFNSGAGYVWYGLGLLVVCVYFIFKVEKDFDNE